MTVSGRIAHAVQNHVERIAADVAERTDAARLFLYECSSERGRDASASTAAYLNMIDLAELAGLDYVFYHLHIRVVARLEADGDYLAVSLLCFSYLDSLFKGDAHGLFEQDIDPVVERVYGALRMGHVVGADADCVELLVVNEFLVRMIDPDSLGCVPLSEELLRLAVDKIRHADKLNIGHLEIFADVALGYPAVPIIPTLSFLLVSIL